MWFKNLLLYQLESPFTHTAETLQEQLENKIFTPCSSNQRESLGWFSPFGRHSEALIHHSQGHFLCRMARQERILPASVIKEETDNRIDELESQGRTIKGKEKKDIREQIEFELLPKAFTRTQFFDGWIDTKNQWVILNTTSSTRAEAFTGLMRKTLGSLPVKLASTENSPISLMTYWLKNNTPPHAFEFGEECQFKDPENDKCTVTFKRHLLLGDELTTNLDSGKHVSQLELIWKEKISFVLTEELVLKKVRFLDIMEDRMNEHDFENAAEKMDIEFTLMTGETSNMIKDLMKALN